MNSKIKYFNISSSYKKYPQRFNSRTTEEEVDIGEREDYDDEEEEEEIDPP